MAGGVQSEYRASKKKVLDLFLVCEVHINVSYVMEFLA